MMKYNKYKCSRFKYKYERDAIAHLESTNRGRGKSMSKMQTRHSNYEWIFVEPIVFAYQTFNVVELKNA